MRSNRAIKHTQNWLIFRWRDKIFPMQLIWLLCVMTILLTTLVICVPINSDCYTPNTCSNPPPPRTVIFIITMIWQKRCLMQRSVLHSYRTFQFPCELVQSACWRLHFTQFMVDLTNFVGVFFLWKYPYKSNEIYGHQRIISLTYSLTIKY